MTYNAMAIEQWQTRLAIEHKQRMIARQAEMTKTRDDYLVDAILCHKELAEQGEALAFAQDTIRIALKTAGYKNVDSMSQFERASAILDMAQECQFLRGRNMLLDCHRRNLIGKVQRGITA